MANRPPTTILLWQLIEGVQLRIIPAEHYV